MNLFIVSVVAGIKDLNMMNNEKKIKEGKI